MSRMSVLSRRKKVLLPLAVVAVLLIAGVVYLVLPSSSPQYQLKLVIPEAAGIYSGVPVRINNVDVGSVTSVGVQNGKAVVEVRIDDGSAPLHAGTEPVVTARSLIGEDYLQLQPGPATAPALPSGSTVQTNWSQVQIEDVLGALDAPTRAQLQSLLKQTSSTLSGHEQNLNSTLQTAGPAVAALGQVMAAVGEDGPAIHELVTKLDQTVAEIAARHQDLSTSVSDLATLTQQVASQQQQLSAGLGQLPATLQAANSTLGKVPAAVSAAQPLLTSLAPASAALPSVAGNLSPLLTDLRPALDELTPTLASADSLLRYTPGLLDSANATLPGISQALNGLAPALNFLRPYTPDLLGWLSNWAGVFGGYDSQGHYGHLLLTLSATAVNNNPGLAPPGLTIDPVTAPGTAAGQPWTDATGGPVQ
jgi:phospholipid/cholesterol/gamma-HCH transport system substrate-binding protein